MDISKTQESFQNNFATEEGAYAYLLINSLRPEFLSFSNNKHQNTFRKELTLSLQNAQSIKEVKDIINSISDEKILLCSQFGYDNLGEKPADFIRKELTKAIKNIEYLDLEWNAKGTTWNNLNGLIEFHDNTSILSKIEENILSTRINSFVQEFGLKELNINSLKSPIDTLHNIEQAFVSLAKIMNVPHQKMGLGALTLSIKSENISFSGYSGPNQDFSRFQDKIVLNDVGSFAHEWFHFLDSALGQINRSVTEFINPDNSFKSMMPHFKELLSFSEVSHSDAPLAKIDFCTAMKDSFYFLGRFASNKENYPQELQELSTQLLSKIQNGSSKEDIHNDLETGLKSIAPSMPPNFIAFGKSVCDLEIKSLSNEKIHKNQFVDYSKINDSYLDMGDYSSSTEEMIARSFEKFIFDCSSEDNSSFDLTKKEKKALSTILAVSYSSDFFPQGEISNKLADYWKNAISEISEVLTNSSSPQHSLNNVAQFIKKRELREKSESSLSQNRMKNA